MSNPEHFFCDEIISGSASLVKMGAPEIITFPRSNCLGLVLDG